ncbi:MAG: hypothetical protein WKG00_41035 [Polyangiaceae bacterium]
MSTDGKDSTLLRFLEAGGNRSVVLEDNGRVAYAYLLVRDEPVADVWLYNVHEAPNAMGSGEDYPFLNPRAFCRDEAPHRFGQRSNVRCHWDAQGVTVSIDGVVMARLERDARPGWSRHATQPGPLARPLSEVTRSG